MSYEDTENIHVGELVAQVHFETTGQLLLPFQMPCLAAVQAGMDAIRDAERAVIDLANDTAHP